MAPGPDKSRVARSFAAAAPGYDEVAGLQRAVGEVLLSSLPEHGPKPRAVLDVGAGTGYFSGRLAQRYPAAMVVALDLAEGMLQLAQLRLRSLGAGLCAGDAEALPLANASIDLIFSNLAIQWCGSPVRVFREFGRVLRPGGLLAFSSFGPATLCELRLAFAAVDDDAHVNDFPGVAALAGALVEAGFAEPVLDAEVLSAEYPDVLALMGELKRMGAHNALAGRPRHLTGKGTLRKVIEAYEGRTDRGIRASFETVYGLARLEANP